MRAFASMDTLIALWHFHWVEDAWTNISERLRILREHAPCGRWADAVSGVAQLADHIGAGRARASLFGWTSMHDLCVQQTDVAPYSGPFLRVRPLDTGMVEFRYHDTAIPGRQWFREVPPAGVMGRFEAFLDQLGWARRTSA
jgi:hypothetical protein